MPDGSARNAGWFRRGVRPRGLPVSHKAAPVVRAREHSVMSVYVRGMGYVDLKPWRPK